MGIFQTIQPVDKHLSEAVEKCSTGFDHRGEYKVDFPYKVWCNSSGIALSAMNKIDSIVTGRWGWNFRPHADMDYSLQNWHERQDAYVTFENRDDAIQVALSIQFD